VFQVITEPDFEKLLFFAEKHEGYFTAKEAALAGYSPQNQFYHVKAGHWKRLSRGIFRLKHFRSLHREHPDFIVGHLWTQNAEGKTEGVISHSSALLAWEMSSLLRYSKIHMTVPKDFRRRSECLYKVELHYGDIDKNDVEEAFGYRLTKPFKTVLDLLIDPKPAIESKHIQEAIEYMMLAGRLPSMHDIAARRFTDHELDRLLWLLGLVNPNKTNKFTLQNLITVLEKKKRPNEIQQSK